MLTKTRNAYPFSDLYPSLEDSNSSHSSSYLNPETSVGADASSLAAVEQINYYAWDRSSKASKLAARGPGLTHPKRDRRARDYMAQLFGDSDGEGFPDMEEHRLPKVPVPVAAPLAARRSSHEKVKRTSPVPVPPVVPPQSSPPQSSGIKKLVTMRRNCVLNLFVILNFK